MAENSILLQICAPERNPAEFSAVEVILPGAAGVFTVRRGHTALLSTLVPGVVSITDAAGESQFFAVSDGFAEIRDDRVTVLCSVFEAGDDVDLARAQAAQERAEQRLRKVSEDVDLARAEMAIHRALARIQASQGKHF